MDLRKKGEIYYLSTGMRNVLYVFFVPFMKVHLISINYIYFISGGMHIFYFSIICIELIITLYFNFSEQIVNIEN